MLAKKILKGAFEHFGTLGRESSDRSKRIARVMSLSGVTIPAIKKMYEPDHMCYKCVTAQLKEYSELDEIKEFIQGKLLKRITEAKDDREKYFERNVNDISEVSELMSSEFGLDKESISKVVNSAMLRFLKKDALPIFSTDLINTMICKTSLVELGGFPGVLKVVEKDIENLEVIISKIKKDIEALEEVCSI